MNNLLSIKYICLFSILLISCNSTSQTNSSVTNSGLENKIDNDNDSVNIVKSDIPMFAKIIIDTYHDFVIMYDENTLSFPDGTTIIFDDYKEKNFIEKLDNCDIEDMFSMTYDTTDVIPKYLNDCGRGRNEQLFKKMYGNTENEVRNNLIQVEWFGQKLLFTKVNHASTQLQKVAEELSQYPQYTKYLTNASTFYWRKVRGANRQSAHSYGIAIDINTKFSNYWLWSYPKSSELDSIKYKNQIPIEIVRVFEKYGFIWGGRWYHFDTMHFEYRPELLNILKE